MKEITLIEEFPLVSIVMKELLENVYPGCRITCHLTISEVDPCKQLNTDLVVCDLYGSDDAQSKVLHALSTIFHHTKKIIFCSGFTPRFEEEIHEMNGLCVARSMGYREIVDAIYSFDRAYSSEIELHSIRNEYQSDIQMPGAEKPLTLKQVQVMELCVQGYSTKEIARKLGLSPETIRAHMKQCYSRLNAKNRAHAVSQFETAKRLSEMLSVSE